MYKIQSRTINDSRVTIIVEPSGSQPYISISDPSIELPVLQGKDSRTGQQQVTIVASGSPAKEALYVVKGRFAR